MSGIQPESQPGEERFFIRRWRWCRRATDKDGVACDPRYLSGFPIQFTRKLRVSCAGTYNSCSGCRIASLISEVVSLHSVNYRKSPMQNRDLATKDYRKYESFRIGIPTSSKPWDGLRETLRGSGKLFHRELSKSICIYTGAFDTLGSYSVAVQFR